MTEYKIELEGVDPNNLSLLKDKIEENRDIFEKAVLANYISDDPRYEYMSDSFEVEDISDSYFSYTAEVSYYNGCKDCTYNDDTPGVSVPYKIVNGCIFFELDESIWYVDN
ncbi:hypothetical protein ACTBCG_003115 [Providencia rettgeri]